MTTRTILLAVVLLIPISAVAQLIDVDCVALFDADGTRVARVDRTNKRDDGFFISHNGVLVPLSYNGDLISGPNNRLFFESVDCSSAPLVEADFQTTFFRVVAVGNDVYYSDSGAVPQEGQFLSSLSEGGNCQNVPGNELVVPAPFRFTLPNTLPFHLEPEACFTPAPEVAALGPRSLLATVLLLAFGAVLLMRRAR